MLEQGFEDGLGGEGVFCEKLNLTYSSGVHLGTVTTDSTIGHGPDPLHNILQKVQFGKSEVDRLVVCFHCNIYEVISDYVAQRDS